MSSHVEDEGVPSIPEHFNMADYFLYDRLNEGHGDRIAIRTRDGERTYAQVAQESDRVANVLMDSGVEPEDRVLIAMPDAPEFVSAIFGTLRIGGVVAMVNPLLPAGDLAGYLEYTRCRALVCDGEVAAKLGPHLEQHPLLRRVLVVGNGVASNGKIRDFHVEVSNASASVQPWPTRADDPAYWLFTSGSTGRPKAVMHLHHDFAWNCERYAKRVLGIDKDDVTLSVPRLYFGYATGTNVFFPFSVGATTCLFPEKPTPEVLFENIQRFQPTILTSVPTSLNQMVSHPEAASQDLSSLRMVLSAGEALPPELYHRWMQAFGVEILDGIGSAEMFHIYISNRPGQVVPGSLGRLVPGYEAKILGPEGQPVPAGGTGTLWIRGDSAGVGYWQQHEESKEVFQGEWTRTADLFRMDENGWFWYAGRADDVMKVSGMFLSPLEVEDTLLRHDAVGECVVVPIQEEGLVKPLALVVARAGVSGTQDLADELVAFAKTHLAAYKFPRRIAFVSSLPRNDRGKVQRKVLREQAAQGAFSDAFVAKAAIPTGRK